LKGAVLTVNPAARLLDLSHRLPPQDLIATAYFLGDVLPWFPRGTVHVVVVDPGVGTRRALLAAEWNGQTVLVPDNGCWTSVLHPESELPRVFRVENPAYWRPEVSATFHGRDILAPVAGHLTLGVRIDDLGPAASDWVRLTLPQPTRVGDRVRGEVVVVDPFGNLVSNIAKTNMPDQAEVCIAGKRVARRVRTYGDAEPGALVALIGSSGRLEVAVVQGSAAAQLGIGVGATIEVTTGASP
jgi:S-adenosyl-L-methionine hydrolase (adenosine-forming)